MARGNPVEFVRLNDDGTYERVGNEVQLADGGSITITNPVAQGALTDRSGDIAAADTSEVVMAANANRRYLIIQNLSTTDVMWIDFGVDAVKDQPSLALAPAANSAGGSFVMEGSFICTQSVSIICATMSEPYAAKEG